MSSTYDDNIDGVVEGMAYLAFFIAFILTVVVIYNTSWSDVEKREISYKQIGWQRVNGVVDSVESRSGTTKPETELVDVSYRYGKSETPIKTTLVLSLGYKPGDNVIFFANKDGQTKVIDSRYIGVEYSDPTIYSTGMEYGMAVFYGVIFWIISGFVIWFSFMILAGLAEFIWVKVKAKPQLTHPTS